MAELADALDLGSSGVTHQSSSLCLPIAAGSVVRGSSSVVEHRLAKARVASSNLVFRSPQKMTAFFGDPAILTGATLESSAPPMRKAHGVPQTVTIGILTPDHWTKAPPMRKAHGVPQAVAIGILTPDRFVDTARSATMSRD